MSHHYKRYTIEQLQQEEQDLKEKLTQAKNLQQKNHIAVYQRKIEIVQSYMLDKSQFQPGDTREILADPTHVLKINEVNGVVAWGQRINKSTQQPYDERKAYLLILLGEKINV